MNKFDDVICNDVKNPYTMNVLALAFIGDAIHSLYVRSIYACDKDYKQKELQSLTSKIVRASNQAKTLDKISENLSEKEKDVLLRARNAKTNNIAKNSTLEEYKKSTSFEALLGYEYLCKDFDRLHFLLELSMSND